MFSSSSFHITSPIFNVDNRGSYSIDDLISNSSHIHDEDHLYSSSSGYYWPSPGTIRDEIDNFGNLLSHPDELAIIQQAIRPNSPVVTEDSSIFEVTNHKMDLGKGEETINGIVEDGNNISFIRPISSANHGLSRRRRSSKGDRHSKIITAHGLRDRRMRLSLEVARQFFKLQDMLGHDKPSQTVEWLMIQSKTAIEELHPNNHAISPSGVTKCTISSTSDCEVESIVIDQWKTNHKGKRSTSTSVTKDMKGKLERKTITKEARQEARARARKRTMERMQSRGLKDDDKLPSCSNSRSNNPMCAIQDDDLVDRSPIGNWNLFHTCNFQQNV